MSNPGGSPMELTSWPVLSMTITLRADALWINVWRIVLIAQKSSSKRPISLTIRPRLLDTGSVACLRGGCPHRRVSLPWPVRHPATRPEAPHAFERRDASRPARLREVARTLALPSGGSREKRPQVPKL